MKFIVKQRSEVFSGRAFKVQKVQLILPNGRETVYDLVVHRGAVVIVPVDQNNEIWLVRQYRLGADDVIYELPAGLHEGEEAPETTAQRELREEIGLAAAQIRSIGGFYLTPGYSTEYLYIFLASELSPEKLAHDADEFLEPVHFPAATVYEMINNGQIRDGKTIAALHLAQPFLKTA
jgi:ADP-ribose pyrophosphatase